MVSRSSTSRAPGFERLSALDASFLDLEADGSYMHVGAVAIFRGGPLLTGAGVVDVERVREYISRVIGTVPRYRQQLRHVPLLNHPVWVDSADFQVDAHVHAVDLGPNAPDQALFAEAARVYSNALDRSRPLWELWIVSGLAGGRFAAIFKVHHCMLDGIAGAGLLEVLFRGTQDADMPPSVAWSARPEPARGELLSAELRHRVDGTAGLLSEAARALRTRPRDAGAALVRLGGTLRAGLSPAPSTPLNPRRVGPRREFAGCRFELEPVKDVKRRLGGTVNDVVLAATAGAMRRWLARNGVAVDRLDGFRAMVPTNIRHAGQPAMGNHVGLLLAELPVAEPDPRRRLELVRRSTKHMKDGSGQAQSSELIEAVSDVTSSALVLNTVRLAVRRRAYNVVVTNVPGPPFPLYLLGGRLESIFPLVPLYSNQAVGVALFSYAGGLYCGVHADASIFPELESLMSDLKASFGELFAAASDD